MSEQNELAVSVEVQQKASLYGIASVLVGTGKIPNKKSMKRMVKQLRKDVISAIGKEGGFELMNQNKGAVQMALKGIKEDPRHNPIERKLVYSMIIEDLYQSYQTGVEKLSHG